jgi:hypothetical protein
MRFKASDAENHTKMANAPKKRAKWARIANEALDEGVAEQEAIKRANDAVSDDEEGETTTEKKPGEGESEEGSEGEDDRALPRQRSFDEVLEISQRDMSLTMAPRSYDPKTRMADAVISTGAKVRRKDWWNDEEWDEALDMSPGSIRLGRFNAGAQFLDGHRYYGGMDAVLGAIVPGSARVEGGELVAKIQFSKAERGQRIAQDLQDGIPILLSAGYRIHRSVRDLTTTPETRTAVDWEPLEVSAVPVSAEGIGTGFRHYPQQRSATMTKAEELAAADAKKRQEEEAAAKKREEEQAAEAKKRADEAVAAATEAALTYAREMRTIARKAGFDDKDLDEAMARKEPLETFRARALDALAEKSSKVRIDSARGTDDDGNDWRRGRESNGRVVFDPVDGRADAMVEAMTTRILAARRIPAILNEAHAAWARRMGKVDAVTRAWQVYDGQEKLHNDRARSYMNMGWSEIAAECLGYTGHIRTARMAGDLIERAFHSTADFPAIFANVLNKALLARYQLAMPTYRQVAIERPFVDFRPHPQIRASEFPLPQELTETGEIRAGTMYENRENVSVKPYGVQIGISRQMIVNDELGAIDQILGSSGDGVLVFENNTFWALFATNPVLTQDGYRVFDASNHNNYESSGSEPTIMPIGKGRAAMRAQKSLSDNYMNVGPAIILAGPAHETRIDQLTAAISAVAIGDVNPFSAKLRPVIEAHITGYEWYLAAEPGTLPNFVYGFLAGATGPRIRTDEPFGVQGIRVSLEVDFGCGAIDYRGIYKDAGSEPTDIVSTVRTIVVES